MQCRSSQMFPNTQLPNCTQLTSSDGFDEVADPYISR